MKSSKQFIIKVKSSENIGTVGRISQFQTDTHRALITGKEKKA